MSAATPFFIKVLGAFDITDAAGFSIRPTGRKDCAIIAILALTSKHRQTRTWLQAALWGSRGPAQAAASLRQSLSVLRGVFGPEHDVICADRTWVWLNTSSISLDYLGDNSSGEILRGFELREDKFSQWLERTRSSKRGVVTERAYWKEDETSERRWFIEPPIISENDEQLQTFARMANDSFVEALGTIGVMSVVDRSFADSPNMPLPTDMIVRLSSARFGDVGKVTLSCVDGFGTVKLLVRRELDLRARMSFQCVQVEICQIFLDFAIQEEASKLQGEQWSAHSNGCKAMLGLLVPGAVTLTDVVQCSETAISANEQGIYHAILGTANLRVFGEREAVGPFDLDALMQSFRTALRLSPGNGLVHALAGHSYGFCARDLDRNAKMTREAVRLLPGSATCWIFYSISLIYTDRFTEATKAANTAAMLARGTAIYPLAQSTQLFARLMAADVKGAVRAGEDAVDSITYRPTVVDLMTAYSLDGRISDGRRKLALLQARDPSLSVDLLRSPEYPIVNPKHRNLVATAARNLGLN